ncbi:MAG: hypothetical protein M1812_003904 [Candelaria pacifica]|nr:MAG: hypothetical protein M1812_003904 [Candelaria pacifica]
MAFIHSSSLPFHDGEQKMHELLRLPPNENPTSPFLTPGAAYMLQRAPLLALGTLDSQGRPWTTIWGGETGFSRPIGQSIVGISTLVDTKYDPVLENLLAEQEDGNVVAKEGSGKMIGGLTIDLETRSRVKLYGKLIAGTRRPYNEEDGSQQLSTRGEAQLVIKIEQSLGNCPKYLNKKHIYPALPSPKLLSSTLLLPNKALNLLAKADCFFISSTNRTSDMDTNYRGGPAGFVRILSNDPVKGTILIYPEYSGNRLYQTLGNLQTTPLAGLVFPDFDTGDVLYVTGNTEILIGSDSTTILAHTSLSVKLTITGARFIESGLAFRGTTDSPSPYNPPIRYLQTESPLSKTLQPNQTTTSTATLISKTQLTPTIARFRFHVTNTNSKPSNWQAGQYIALDFSSELNLGYSHMRDSDPKSLNDDYIRTFTISSSPPPPPSNSITANNQEFEITIRNVGSVTNFLFRQNPRAGLEVPIRGIGGEFRIAIPENENDEEEDTNKIIVPFIAGGIGITPLLSQLPSLKTKNLRIFWTLNISDLGLVTDTIKKYPTLKNIMRVFFTGDFEVDDNDDKKIEELEKMGLNVHKRRIRNDDLKDTIRGMKSNGKWYFCTGKKLRERLVGWLEGGEGEFVYEDFGY